MDSFELNKIIGAILGTLLFVMGVGFLAEAIYTPIEGRGPGYSLPEPEGTDQGGEPAVEVAAVPIGTLLASADVAQGATAARKCQSCHTFEQGGGNKQGPALYGTVGGLIGGHDGFAYSEPFLALKAAGETWTYEQLNAWLLAPRAHIPGTKMVFAGIKNDAERANLIAYMASLSPGAPPFPAPEAAPEAEPTDGTAPSPEGTEPVATDANAIATPTTTGTETQVEGTPAPATTDGAAETPAQ